MARKRQPSPRQERPLILADKVDPRAATSRSDEPDEESFVYQVAVLAWWEGLAPNAIAQRLGGPHLIMKVKRALVKAVRGGMLRFEPPAMVAAAEQLQANAQWKAREYTVVADRSSTENSSVYLKGAEKICELVVRILDETRSSGADVTVANAGGHTVSETIKCLHRIAPSIPPEDRTRLVFLSLNSAGRRESFDKSANFLAVRLAEIFGARHLAVLPPSDPGIEQEYTQRVENIHILICGAGSRHGMLAVHIREQHLDLPASVVGDFGFIALDANGRPVQSADLQKAAVALSAQPDYAEVLRIARDPARYVLVLLCGEDPQSKVDISHAILKAGLATHCVIGLSIAEPLIKKFGEVPDAP